MSLHPLMCVSILICICVCVCVGVCVLCHMHTHVWHSGPEQSSDSSRAAARWCLPGGADGDPACQSPGAPTSLSFTWSHLVSSKSSWVLFIHSLYGCVKLWGAASFASDVCLCYRFGCMNQLRIRDQSRQSEEKLLRASLKETQRVCLTHWDCAVLSYPPYSFKN